jgi:single-stranded-DNA-specific exonuclease
VNTFRTPREVICLRDVDRAAASALAERMNVSLTVATILAGRGLTTYDACREYFRPSHTSFHDPFLLHGMQRAVERIRSAIERSERITVYGDYDVDGVSATALLMRVLSRLGARCDHYLPNRLTEGYGMSAEGVDECARRGTSCIITVDCGIGAAVEVERAKAAGIDCIVSDHHEPHGILPGACAVINPRVSGCAYPCADLAGAGVALKICQALAVASNKGESLWEDFLELAALGTAADIVPLLGENRVIVSLGFDRLAHTANPGLRALMQQQGISGGDISTTKVVFQIAPCINAAGRLGDPSRGVQLLLTEDPAQAQLYARELREANRERQALDAQVQEEAIAWVQANCDPERDFAIVAAQPHWHAGVIGIAASRVVEKFCRPAFLFTIGSDGRAKGSGRSIAGLHLLEALNECSGLLETYGGHAAAAGATISAGNIDAFRRRFNDAVKSRVRIEDLVPRIVADAEVGLGELDRKFLNIIKQMGPFGPGNMRPVLLCSNLRHRSEPRIVGRGHLKMAVTASGMVMDAIAFNFGERLDEIRGAGSFSLAFALDENEWNGQVNLQMKVKGVKI